MGRNHERTDERKDENYIPLSINAGGIISWGKGKMQEFAEHLLYSLPQDI